MSFQNYRAAISLNNTAVTLLERQRYHDALDTFKDSLSLIKSVFASSLQGAEGKKQHDDRGAEPKLVSRYLTQASRRLANPVEERPHDKVCVKDCYSLHPFHLLVLSEEVMHPAFVNTAAVFSRTVEFAVRIVDIVELNSSCGEEELAEMMNLDLDIATILFNCAIAHRCCLAFSSSEGENVEYSSEQRMKLWEGSINFLEWAQTILRRELNRIFSSAVNNLSMGDMVAANRTVLLSICTSKSLSGIHVQAATIQHHGAQVERLYDLFLDLQFKLPNYFHSPKSGAAAA